MLKVYLYSKKQAQTGLNICVCKIAVFY